MIFIIFMWSHPFNGFQSYLGQCLFFFYHFCVLLYFCLKTNVCLIVYRTVNANHAQNQFCQFYFSLNYRITLVHWIEFQFVPWGIDILFAHSCSEVSCWKNSTDICITYLFNLCNTCVPLSIAFTDRWTSSFQAPNVEETRTQNALNILFDVPGYFWFSI